MKILQSFIALATLLCISSNLLCNTVYVRNYAPYRINAEVRIRSLPNITAYNIAPGEERHIGTAANCVNGIVIYSSDTRQSLKQWDWGRPYNVFESIGDRKPCGSNVFTYTDDKNGRNICHLGVSGNCDGRIFNIGQPSVNE